MAYVASRGLRMCRISYRSSTRSGLAIVPVPVGFLYNRKATQLKARVLRICEPFHIFWEPTRPWVMSAQMPLRSFSKTCLAIDYWRATVVVFCCYWIQTLSICSDYCRAIGRRVGGDSGPGRNERLPGEPLSL